MAQLGILKIEDLYRQQVRIHAWKFWHGRLPPSQACMLGKVKDAHGHSTRSAQLGIALKTKDHRSIAYRIPKEWEACSKTQKETRSITGFKLQSKKEFLAQYAEFKCNVKHCFVCSYSRNAESM